MHHLYAALRANHLYHRDQHYVVQDGEVIIVDEFTGRLMTGRRWSDGLHQAVEAKEGVPIQSENQTLASITFQNYFRMYGKLSGMTGTADTEAYEFQEIYGLETVVIPPNRPTHPQGRARPASTRPAREKYEAVIEDIRDCHERGQPVLVGTTSIENSELISGLLHKAKLPHQVLNAKQHAREAEIVAQAGRPGDDHDRHQHGRPRHRHRARRQRREARSRSSTPTRRSTPSDKAARAQQLHDEWQGLHDAVKAQGGLRIIATERHESRRIDNQLRGRSGRQGDPGSSRFYLSLDDPLMRIFAGDRVRAIMERLKMPDGEAIEAGIVTRSHRERAAQGRGAQLRHPQAAARVRRRRQRPAQGDLPAAQRHPRGRRPGGADRHPARRRDAPTWCAPYVPAESVEEQWDLPALEKVLRDEWQLDLPLAAEVESSDADHRRGHRREGASRRPTRRSTSKVERVGARAVHAVRAHGPAAVRSTRTGASTWPRSTTCARASTCAAMRRRTRSRNTSARRSSCSRSCSTSVKMEVTARADDGAHPVARKRSTQRGRRRSRSAPSTSATSPTRTRTTTAACRRKRRRHAGGGAAAALGRRRRRGAARSAATTRARAAAARSTSSATASSPELRHAPEAPLGGARLSARRQRPRRAMAERIAIRTGFSANTRL